MYSNEEIANVEIFPDLKIDLEKVFEYWIKAPLDSQKNQSALDSIYF